MANDNKSKSEKKLKAEMLKQLEEVRDEGLREGIKMGQKQILDWLQNAYIEDSGRPDRGSPKGEAILEIARAAASHFKIKLKMTK